MITRVIGLDLSYRSSGVAILDDGLQVETIKPHGRNIRKLLVDIESKLESALRDLGYIDVIVIEDIFMNRNIRLMLRLVLVHGILLTVLGKLDIEAPILYVHPATLKRLATGHGGRKTTKQKIIDVINDLTGRVLQNDEADATALAYIGRALAGNYLTRKETYYSDIACDELDDIVWREFGLKGDDIRANNLERGRQARREYKRRSKGKKANG